jgi:site-specific DNA-methyltransferase (adenine-specific)
VDHTLKVTTSSESVEWFTPAPIIALVYDVLGSIFLDPCSCREANETVKADHIFTKEDGDTALNPDTLWPRTVYMNPPYGRKIGPWVRKLDAQYRADHTTAAIGLLPARVDTKWWKHLAAYTVCFWSGRVKFSGSKDAAPFPTAIVYLGPDDAHFIEVFGQHGLIYRPVTVTPSKPVQRPLIAA